jgi:hypothetical protein
MGVEWESILTFGNLRPNVWECVCPLVDRADKPTGNLIKTTGEGLQHVIHLKEIVL